MALDHWLPLQSITAFYRGANALIIIMHESWLPPVSPLQDHVVTSKALDPLPVLNPHFFIPRLEDKPQNPIMDTLRIMQNRLHDHPPPPTFVLPPELHALSEDTLLFAEKRRNALESLWELAASRKSGFGVSSVFALL